MKAFQDRLQRLKERSSKDNNESNNEENLLEDFVPRGENRRLELGTSERIMNTAINIRRQISSNFQESTMQLIPSSNGGDQALQSRIEALEKENQLLQELVDEQAKQLRKMNLIINPVTRRISINRKRISRGIAGVLDNDNSVRHQNETSLHDMVVEEENEDCEEDESSKYINTHRSSKFKKELKNNRYMTMMNKDYQISRNSREVVILSPVEVIRQSEYFKDAGDGAIRTILRIVSMFDEFNLKDAVRKEKKKKLGQVEHKNGFAQFTLLSVPLLQLVDSFNEKNSVSKLLSHEGSRYLDPFIFKTAVTEDVYPNNTQLFSTEVISIFCFASGVKSWLIPKSANRRLRQEFTETEYQAITFTGEDGGTTLGLAVTTVEEEHSSVRSKVLPILQQHRKKRVAKKRLVRWIEKMWILKKTDRGVKFQGKKESNKLNSSFFIKGKDEKVRNNSFKKKGKWDLYKLRMKAQEAYSEHKNNDEDSDILLVQKCYVFMDVKQSERICLCAAMQQIIDRERRENAMMGSSQIRSRKQNPTENLETLRNRHQSRRHDVLEFVRLHLPLDDNDKNIEFPVNDIDMIRNKAKVFKKKLPIKFVRPIEYPLPLPKLDEEFGLAVLVTRLGSDVLVKLLQVLLAEYSVLVVGKDSEEVTCVLEALKLLLKPYKWAGAFLPSMPYGMIEFVASPVPFMAGITVKELQRISQNNAVQSAYAEGLSIVNITHGKAAISLTKCLQEVLLPRPSLSESLGCLSKRLELSWQNKSFATFISSGIEPETRVTLRSIRTIVEEFMISLSAKLNLMRESYKAYGIEEEGDFYFSPQKYIESLNNETRFLQAMAHTQMFISYVDMKREDFIFIQNAQRSKMAKILARWIWNKWCEYKRKLSRG